MTHYRIFATVVLVCFGWLFGHAREVAGSESQDRPNLLFIFLDDYGWRDCGFMGSDFYETPNLDRLAGQGMVFTNAYSTAANCAPARACLLSGQYTPRHEIYNVGTSRRGPKNFGKLMHVPGVDTLGRDNVTWAKLIQGAGYVTGTIGKWHLSDDPIPYGFDVNVAGDHRGSPPKGYFPPHPNAVGLESAPASEYLTDRLTDESVRFIDDHSDQPWLLYLTHFAVHTPLQAKPELVAKYQAKPAGKLHDSAVMAAMIQSVDEGVGRIVETLKQHKIDQKTIVVFTSDNGGYGPATSMQPLKGYKGTYYEGGIREPMFIRWLGVTPAGSQSDVPVINVDLFPTFCEMLGVKIPESKLLDGQSLVPVLKQADLQADHPLLDRALFWHFPAYLQSYAQPTDQQRDPLYRSRPCGIIRRGQWKLHEYFEDSALELYDLANDLGETNNLVDSNPAQAERLHKEMKAWRERVSAPVPTQRNPNFSAPAEAKAIAKAKRRSRE